MTVLSAVLLVSGGCYGLVSKAFMNTSTRTPQKELSYNDAVNARTVSALIALSDKKGIPLSKLIKALDREANRAHKTSSPSMAAMLTNQMSLPYMEKSLKAGTEWTTGLISQVAGGAVGGTGLIGTIVGLMRSRNKKVRALNLVKVESTPEELAKLKKAAEHTGLEKEVG
tara:strand:+ start:320 stop:829 length:510 start_codon:yes stop_codon:yes gene_type:complete